MKGRGQAARTVGVEGSIKATARTKASDSDTKVTLGKGRQKVVRSRRKIGADLRSSVILGVRPLEEVGVALLSAVVQSTVRSDRRCFGCRVVLGDRSECLHLVREKGSLASDKVQTAS